MSLIRNCVQMSRGDDWIKLLADVAYDGRIRDFDALKAEHDLLWHRLKVSHPAMGDGPGGYGRPEVMKSGLWKDRVVFKFRIKSYSEKVNDLYQYVYDFGELADKRTEREAEGARFMEGLRGINESIMRLAEKNCADKDDKPFRHRIKIPDVKIITMEELARMQKEKELSGSEIQFVPDGAGVSPTEPGIRFGGREIRSFASRFEKYGII